MNEDGTAVTFLVVALIVVSILFYRDHKKVKDLQDQISILEYENTQYSMDRDNFRTCIDQLDQGIHEVKDYIGADPDEEDGAIDDLQDSSQACSLDY